SSKMHSLLSPLQKHPLVATVGLSLALKLGWSLWQGYRTPKPILEVLMFNELSQECHKPSKEPSECSNAYCATCQVDRIVEHIDRAAYAIDVAMYTLSSERLVQAILRAAKRGVELRILSDKEMTCSVGSQVRALANQRVPVRFPDSPLLLHHKFCLIDGALRVRELKKQKRRAAPFRGSVIISGSVNWTRQGFTLNWENCVISGDQELADEFEKEFERMWSVFSRPGVGCVMEAK
ncbi:hypothetical protein KR018_008758, partial [Drosophila ironensis]